MVSTNSTTSPLDRDQLAEELKRRIAAIERASDGGNKGVQCIDCGEWCGEHRPTCNVVLYRSLLVALSLWQPIEDAPKDGTVFYIDHSRGIRRAWYGSGSGSLYYEAPGRGEIVDEVITRFRPLD